MIQAECVSQGNTAERVLPETVHEHKPEPKIVSIAHRRFLTSSSLDIWLIGGASLIFWIVMQIASEFRSNPAIARQFSNVAATAGAMSLLVNFPHFIISYKIAYARGFRFVMKHWFQLLFVPLALIGLFIYAYKVFTDPSPLPPIYNPFDFKNGEGLVSLLVMLMFFTVGWHYIKQTFGCMMVFGSFHNYRLSKFQRRCLLALLYAMVTANLLAAHVGPPTIRYFYGIRLFSLGLPMAFSLLNQIVVLGLAVAFVYFAIWRKWQTEGQLPPMTFVVPLVALSVWWLPIAKTPEFFLIVPFFHSLQYLPFAFKYERRRNESRNRRPGTGTFQILFAIALGYCAFEVVPYFLNENHSTGELKNVMFFVIAAHVFINIHHYFIDNVVWKFHQPEVQEYILDIPPKRAMEI